MIDITKDIKNGSSAFDETLKLLKVLEADG